jgi:hypothetical protein
VTGKNIYRFYRQQENHLMKVVHTGIQKKDLAVSTYYTCHAWLSDGRLLLCTDQGEILLLENSGDFKMVLSSSPGENFDIANIISFSKGFMISGDNGKILVYEKSEEIKNPYFLIAQLPTVQHSSLFEDSNIRKQGVFNPKFLS